MNDPRAPPSGCPKWPELRRSELELPSLRYSYRRCDNTDGSGTVGELRLQKDIRNAWIASRRGRYIDPEADGVFLPTSLKLGSAGFADIILVDTNSAATLQVIEVKRAAKPGDPKNGVPQLMEAYVPWLKRQFGTWRIAPILIALNISDSVVIQAETQGIECWEFSPSRREFTRRASPNSN